MTLEPRGLDELARRSGPTLLLPARARGVLEDAAAAGLVERRSPLPPLEHLRDLLLQPLLVRRAEPDRRLQHDAPGEAAPAVGERNLAPRDHAVATRSIHHRQRLHHLGPVAAVAAGVHVHAPTHRAGNA